MHGGRYKDHKGNVKHISEKDSFVENIRSVERVEDREQIAQIIMDRLIFIKFLQSKGIIKTDVLRYISEYPEDTLVPKLRQLFFAVLNTEEEERLDLDKQFEGIPYLNGSLFNLTEIERKNTEFRIKAEILKDVINFLDGFKFVHREKEDADSINPEILGYIFERAMTATDRKGTGAYYTPKSITKYISENTIYPCIIEKTNEILKTEKGYKDTELIRDIDELFILPATTLKEIWEKIILKLRVLDNACGSGAFLLAAANILFELNKKINDKIGAENPDTTLKIIILVNNLYGVDINPNGIEIAKLRLWLWLADSYEPGYIKPLPNIDYNLRVGNSLIGYVDLGEFRGAKLTLSDFLRDEEKPTLDSLLKERNDLIHEYKITWGEEAKELKSSVQELDVKISNLLNSYLYREFREKKIKINREAFLKLTPFHWGFEFYEVFDAEKPKEERGFDVVMGNPPWGSKFEFISSEIVDKFLRLPVKNVNIFSVFLYYTFKQLNSNGRLGYLIPKVFVKNKAYTFYRTSLVRKIERIADWGKFPGVASETISIIASGRALDKGIVIVDEFLAEKHETNRVPIESILENKECILSLYLDENKWKIIKSIEVNSKLLSNYFDIKRGMEFGQSGELIFCENCKNYSEKPAKVYKQTELKECPFCKQKIVIKESKSRPLVSKVKQGDFMEPVLTGRCIDAWAIKENLFISPDLPGINYKKELMDRPRILVQRISDKIKATYNAGDSYLLNTVYALMTKDKNRTRCFIILDILNSKLMDFYYEYRYNIGMSLTTQVTIDFLKNIPIKLPVSQQSFIYLCNYMLLLNETEARRKTEQELIEYIDKQVIDTLVYELYFGEKFKEDGLKPNLLGLVEHHLKDVEGLEETDEEKLKVIKEVVERIKGDKKVKEKIEKIKNHEWVEEIERS